jgi:hypothetical protein
MVSEVPPGGKPVMIFTVSKAAWAREVPAAGSSAAAQAWMMWRRLTFMDLSPVMGGSVGVNS